jgi:hypothetical protein
VILVSYHVNLNEVQETAELSALLDAPIAKGPFDRLGWFRGLAEDCGVTPLLAVARDGGALAILPLAQSEAGLRPLSNWYAFTVRPVFSEGADAHGLLTAIARDLKKKADSITLSPVPNEAAEATQIIDAFRAAGWFVAHEPCDTNHHLALDGRSYAQYLAARPGQLRTTLKRKAKKVAVTLHDRFDEAAWADYEAIYAQSWKPEEGSPAFLRRFAREEGAAGRLRLGVAHAELDGVHQPVAAQLWTVEGGTAYIHKLAYVEAAKPLSPGTSLSAALFERVIDGDKVDFIDFGTGDDPYKRDWMELQRPRYRIAMHRKAALAQWPSIAKIAAKRLVTLFQAG